VKSPRDTLRPARLQGHLAIAAITANFLAVSIVESGNDVRIVISPARPSGKRNIQLRE
jgi:hypothetical protein